MYLGIVIQPLQLLHRVGNSWGKLCWLLVKLMGVRIRYGMGGEGWHSRIGVVWSRYYLTVCDVASPTGSMLSLRR